MAKKTTTPTTTTPAAPERPADEAKPVRWVHPDTGEIHELMPPVVRVGISPGYDRVDETRLADWHERLQKKGWKLAPADPGVEPAERSDR